jgi:flavin reductase (DIM6/NTAB) family NADH-FMN oxidoreductase RutF
MKRLTPADLDPRSVYFLMTSLVVPRPIAWVSTVSSTGKCNLAPYSHFNNCSANPPIVQFVSNGEKDTLRNVKATSEFVVNVVSDHLKQAMRITAANWPSDVDEFEMAGLERARSSMVAPPRVASARAALECRVRQILPMGEGNMVFGDVLCFHVSPNILIDGRIDSELLQPVGKLAGTNYSTIHRVERLELPVDHAKAVADYRASWGNAASEPPVIA